MLNKISLCIFFYYSSADRHLNWFCVLAIVTRTTTSTDTPVSLVGYRTLWVYAQKQYNIVVLFLDFFFWETSTPISVTVAPVYTHSSYDQKNVLSQPSHQHLLLSIVLMITILARVRWNHKLVLISEISYI